MSNERKTAEISRRHFIARSTGHRTTYPFAVEVFGPVLVDVIIEEHGYRDDVKLYDTYTVQLDGKHQFGGFAHHLPESGMPDVSFLLDVHEIVDEISCSLCGGDGWTDSSAEIRGRNNSAHAHDTTCVACDGTGVEPRTTKRRKTTAAALLREEIVTTLDVQVVKLRDGEFLHFSLPGYVADQITRFESMFGIDESDDDWGDFVQRPVLATSSELLHVLCDLDRKYTDDEALDGDVIIETAHAHPIWTQGANDVSTFGIEVKVTVR